jgi:peptidyl-tRNA hydrolase
MAPGKIASQAGHAFLGAFLRCQDSDRAQAEAQIAGIPCSLITDSGCPNFFNGQPIITALGLGPANENQIKHITRRFQLL